MEAKNLKLTKIKDIRRLLADTINDLRNDRTSPQTASAIGSLSSILLKILQAGEMEKRVSELEKALGIESSKGSIVSDIKKQSKELLKVTR